LYVIDFQNTSIVGDKKNTKKNTAKSNTGKTKKKKSLKRKGTVKKPTLKPKNRKSKYILLFFVQKKKHILIYILTYNLCYKILKMYIGINFSS